MMSDLEFLCENFSSVTKNGQKYMIAPTNGKFRVYTKSKGDDRYKARDFDDLESAKAHGENHISSGNQLKTEAIVESVIQRLDELGVETLKKAFVAARQQNSRAALGSDEKRHPKLPTKLLNAIHIKTNAELQKAVRMADPHFGNIVGAVGNQKDDTFVVY